MRQPFTKEQADALKVMLAPLEGSVRELVGMISPLNERMAALENPQLDEEPEPEMVAVDPRDVQIGDWIGQAGYFIGAMEPEVSVTVAVEVPWDAFQQMATAAGLRGYRD